MIGYKLFRVRKNGTIGPLFINRKAVLPINEWMEAEEHRTKGFAFRPGWHACIKPEAPHLKTELANGEVRRWYKVELAECRIYNRPESQGGTWVLAQFLKILEEVK